MLTAMIFAVSAFAQTLEMKVGVGRPGAEIQPTMYGIFIEDINFAADGGLYAELVKNRSFEFSNNRLQGWAAGGRLEVMNDGPFERNPHYVRLFYPGHDQKHTALQNDGFFGIGLKAGAGYRFSVWARIPEGNAPGVLDVELIGKASMAESQVYASAAITVDSMEWKKYEVVMTSPVTDPKATLRIFLNGRETVDVEHISLFPTDTWKGHENGLRKDLAQALYDLHPGLFRFPGGCIVEGTDLDTRFQWKNSVGPVENRPLNENRWQHTFRHRYYPDYFQSYGLGFYEYFLLAEEIGAEPLPVISCGLACQFQNDLSAHQPVDSLDCFIDDALDLIEFANGGTDTEWGKVRAEMGHPEPFDLKFIAIGNEQWGPEYPERLAPFVEGARKAYPEILIVGSAGPNSEGDQFDYLWPEMKRLGADLVDEHFYRPESWFLSQGARYDGYDRKGPKVFAGEYACHGVGKKWNHFNASLLEAAFMTTLERNADIVHMATYAPLFAHVEGWQWRPDLIWFDNLRSMRTCSWHVQELYSRYMGTNTLTLTDVNGVNITGAEGQNGIFASAVYDRDKNRVYVKVINVSDAPQPVRMSFEGLKKKAVLKGVEAVSFHSDDPDAENTLDDPERIVPVYVPLDFEGRTLETTVASKTFMIYVLQK